MAQPHRSPIDGFPPDTDRSAGKIPAARRGCATVTGLLNAGAAVGAVGPSRTTMSTEVKTNSVSSRIAWNKGRLVGQKRPLRPKEVWAIRVRLQMKHRKRDLALFNLAIDSKLRGCDLVSLRVDDIAAGGRVRDRATIIQHKTCRPVQFEIMEQTRASVQEWLDARPADRGHVFPRARPASPDCAAIRAHSAWLDRGRRDGQHGLRHAFATPHQGGSDLPKDRQFARGPGASRNGYIVPTNSRLKLVSATGSTRASAKWCRSGDGSKAAASSSSSFFNRTARSPACRHG